MAKRKQGYSSDDYEEYSGDGSEDDGRAARPQQRRRGPLSTTARATARSRPTNNQLLYKAYFRWNHYAYKLHNGTSHLPTETDACASVTAAFLQVLHTMHVAESCRVGDKRNILQILSNNTRRTKVVELSTGTHRVPDELRKHYLSDGEHGQYSTNLDRNRYGNDDQYLFTVIRYDLEFLGLCPCMVDVEIIDAKNDNQSIFVSAGPEACSCNKDAAYAPERTQQHPFGAARSGHRALEAALGAYPLPGTTSRESPKRSTSGVSQLFDALVMAATGGNGAAAAALPGAGMQEGILGGEPPVDSRFGTGGGIGSNVSASGVLQALVGGGGGGGGGLGGLSGSALNLLALGQGALGGGSAAGGHGAGGVGVGGGLGGGANAAGGGAGNGAAGGPRQHHLPSRQKSRLWSALSYGDVDSLQNALDAFRAEEEIASGPAPALSDALGAEGGGGAQKRRRKPVRGPSSSQLALDSSLLGSLLKGPGLSGLREKSGDNAAGADVISSGHAARGPAEPAASQEGDSDPRGSGSRGAGGNGAGGLGRRNARDGVVDGNDDGTVEDGPEAANVDGDGMDGVGNGGGIGNGGVGGGGPLSGRRVRHVPRQSSAVNLATRVGPAEVKRLSAELDLLQQENRHLEAQNRRMEAQLSGGANGEGAAADARLRQLEQEVLLMRQEMLELARGKRGADDKVATLTAELATTRATANQVLQRILQNGSGMAAAAAAMAGLAPGAAAQLGTPGPSVLNKAPSPMMAMQPGVSLLAGPAAPRPPLDQRPGKAAHEQHQQGDGANNLGSYPAGDEPSDADVALLNGAAHMAEAAHANGM